jgi:hypothetical protein
MLLKSKSVCSGSKQLVRSRSSDNLPTSQSQVNIQMMSHTLTIREVSLRKQNGKNQHTTRWKRDNREDLNVSFSFSTFFSYFSLYLGVAGRINLTFLSLLISKEPSAKNAISNRLMSTNGKIFQEKENFFQRVVALS